MINDGIYEQIVNEKLQKELNQLDLSKYDIDLDKIDADDYQHKVIDGQRGRPDTAV